MLPRESVKALSEFLRGSASAERADIAIERALLGLAGRLHCLISVEFAGGPMAGRHALVVRGSAEAGDGSIGAAEEFAIRRVAFAAGLTTPEPLWLDATGEAIGRPFMVLRHVPGTADAAILQRELSAEEGDRLAYRLGQELAQLHRIRIEQAPPEIGFLVRPTERWAEGRAAAWRATLDSLAMPQPCFEWAINWFLDHAPRLDSFALCHRDLRLGNFVADGQRLLGILDLELVGWSDPMEDLGWLCARGARLGLPEREAGGVGSREALYDGYKEIAGRDVDDRRVRFWEIAAALRQGITALERAARPAGEAEHGLDTILGGFRSIEAEYDLLTEIEQFDREVA